MKEDMAHEGGMHLLYGYKTEFSLFPNGPSISHTHSVSGFKADIDICCLNVGCYKKVFKNISDDLLYEDQVELSHNYSASWAVLIDKGYTDLARTVKVYKSRNEPSKLFAYRR